MLSSLIRRRGSSRSLVRATSACESMELAAKPQKGQIWIKRVMAEMGGKDAIVVDGEVDVDAAVHGVMVSAFGYQGQKCSACSRAIVDQAIYQEFVEKLQQKVATLKVGPPDDPNNYMGPVISDSAKKSIMGYIEQGKRPRAVSSSAAIRLLGRAIFLILSAIADVD